MEETKIEVSPVQENTQSTEEVSTKFCVNCGKKIAKEAVVCPLCGCQVEELKTSSNNPNIVINNANTNNNNNAMMASRMRNKWVAVLLCLFLGGLGIHKFYEGKVGMGILYIFTVGLCGIGCLIDLIVLLCKPNPYYV